MEVKALTKNARMSPIKVREVAREIQGLPANEAMDLLKFIPRKSARLISKTLASAIANAENNHNLDVDELVVSEAFVGKNMVMKRGRPRGRGRFGKIVKPFSELTITVRQVEEQA